MGDSLVAMKLVLLLAALSACAWAAPHKFMETDVLVPETVAVQLPDTIATLKEQFNTLQVQLKAGAEVTPGIKATIDKMVTMVNSRIEPAIKEAHHADQTQLNTKMAAIQSRNDAFTEADKLLQQDADNVRALIDDEQAKSKVWENQAAKFTGAQDEYLSQYTTQTTSCCNRDNAAVLDVEYVPAYASCDYKNQDTSGGCADRARKAVSDVVTSPFTDGLKLYRSLRKKCKELTISMNNAEADTTKKFGQCGTDRTAAQDAAKLASAQQARMQAAWDSQTAQYAKDYAKLMKAYTDKEAVVKSDEADRVQEWGAVKTITCMLVNYKKGGGFNEEAEQSCKDSINTAGVVDIGYPAVVAEKQPHLKPFEDQADDSAYATLCDARAAAPAFTCTVGEPRPIPQCTNDQPQPPATTHHEGPYDEEKEAASWALDAAIRHNNNLAGSVKKTTNKKTECTTTGLWPISKSCTWCNQGNWNYNVATQQACQDKAVASNAKHYTYKSKLKQCRIDANSKGCKAHGSGYSDCAGNVHTCG